MNTTTSLPRSVALVILLAVLVAGPGARGQTILNSWPGMAATGFVPPDPHGAAGPSGILQTVNTSIRYFGKTGNTIWGSVNLATFWAGVGNTGQGISDPKALFDQGSGRFYVIMQENVTTPVLGSFLNVAVSRTSNPTGSGTDQWFFYRIDMTQTVLGTRYGGDYPGLAVDGRAVYVTYNMYPLPIARGSGVFLNNQIIVLNKADFNRGVPTVRQVFAPPGISSSLVPVSVVGDDNPGNRAYFVQVSLPVAVNLWSLEDPLGVAILLPPFPVPVPPNGDIPGPGAPQAGTTNLLETLGEELKAQGNAIWHNGGIWFCYTGSPLFQGKSLVYYYQLNTGGFPIGIPTIGVPNFSDPGIIDGGSGVWTFQPALGVNSCGDVCMVYCESSTAEFPRIMCAVRPRGAGAFSPAFVVKQSPSFYRSSFGSTGPWGDYASVSVDPTDGSFWVSHEWARSSVNDDWGTWWAQISVIAPPGRDLFVNSGFCVFRTGARDCTAIPPAGPLATVQAGISQALCGDTVNISTGSYNEQFNTTKAVRLQAYNGPVTIGQ